MRTPRDQLRRRPLEPVGHHGRRRALPALRAGAHPPRRRRPGPLADDRVWAGVTLRRGEHQPGLRRRDPAAARSGRTRVRRSTATRRPPGARPDTSTRPGSSGRRTSRDHHRRRLRHGDHAGRRRAGRASCEFWAGGFQVEAPAPEPGSTRSYLADLGTGDFLRITAAGRDLSLPGSFALSRGPGPRPVPAALPRPPDARRPDFPVDLVSLTRDPDRAACLHVGRTYACDAALVAARRGRRHPGPAVPARRHRDATRSPARSRCAARVDGLPFARLGRCRRPATRPLRRRRRRPDRDARRRPRHDLARAATTTRP